MARVSKRSPLQAATGALCGLLLSAAPMAGVAADPDQGHTRLQVVSRTGGSAITSGVDVEVWARDGRQATRKVAQSQGNPAQIRLGPDQYRVVATYRDARVVRDIVVSSQSDPVKTISLEIGEIALELLPAPGAAPLRKDVSWTVRHYRRGAGAGKPVVRTTNPTPTLGLAEGWYKVRAQYGGRTTSHIVEAAAGRTYTYSLFVD